MKRTEFVWFDLGYTLVYLDREVPYQKLLEHFSIYVTLSDITKAFHLADKFFMREHKGLLGEEQSTYMDDYILKLNQYLNIDLTLTYHQMQLIYNKLNIKKYNWKAYPYTIQTIKSLKSKGLGIGLISNWDNSAKEVLKQNGLLDLFDEVIISSEVRVKKPDPQIFELAMKKRNLSAQQCVYIGDNYYDDIVGSAQLGMMGMLINPFGNLGTEELSIKTYKNIKEATEEIV